MNSIKEGKEVRHGDSRPYLIRNQNIGWPTDLAIIDPQEHLGWKGIWKVDSRAKRMVPAVNINEHDIVSMNTCFTGQQFMLHAGSRCTRWRSHPSGRA
jgi:hypothetical protein